MLSDPKNQQEGIEQAAALANGNQRITRILTVIALNLTENTRLRSPELDRAGEWVETAFGLIATAIESGKPDIAQINRVRALLEGLQFPLTASQETAQTNRARQRTYAQLTRAATEPSAILSVVSALYTASLSQEETTNVLSDPRQ